VGWQKAFPFIVILCLLCTCLSIPPHPLQLPHTHYLTATCPPPHLTLCTTTCLLCHELRRPDAGRGCWAWPGNLTCHCYGHPHIPTWQPPLLVSPANLQAGGRGRQSLPSIIHKTSDANLYEPPLWSVLPRFNRRNIIPSPCQSPGPGARTHSAGGRREAEDVTIGTEFMAHPFPTYLGRHSFSRDMQLPLLVQREGNKQRHRERAALRGGAYLPLRGVEYHT